MVNSNVPGYVDAWLYNALQLLPDKFFALPDAKSPSFHRIRFDWREVRVM